MPLFDDQTLKRNQFKTFLGLIELWQKIDVFAISGAWCKNKVKLYFLNIKISKVLIYLLIAGDMQLNFQERSFEFIIICILEERYRRDFHLE